MGCGIETILILMSASFAVIFFGVILYIYRSGGRQTRNERAVRDELRIAREESANAARQLREELAKTQNAFTETIVKTLSEIGSSQTEHLEDLSSRLKELTGTNESRMERLRDIVDSRMKSLQEGNEKKLDQMRHIVDERLQGTLEKRLGESFKLVSERLEAVQRGLGEMQNLAAGVGDLKRVLTNVKVRGTWAEIQLGALLEQVLSPDQYAKNVQVKPDSRETVEYAIRLPGRDEMPDSRVWLPIDSKFPQEDYLRLVDASEKADTEALQRATAGLLKTVQVSASQISSRYLAPPETTDFAIMFLPTEGLYAEVLRQPGQVEEIQQRYRVVIAGPSTLAAILSSIRMGFQTFALEKRSHEVWSVLAAVKTEFASFGEVLSRLRRQLAIASNTVEKTEKRTRAMTRKLRDVQSLPEDESSAVLGIRQADNDYIDKDDI